MKVALRARAAIHNLTAMLDRLFALNQRQTTVGRELQAGLTTLVAMASILTNTGKDKPALRSKPH